jgi:hypothetical protein
MAGRPSGTNQLSAQLTGSCPARAVPPLVADVLANLARSLERNVRAVLAERTRLAS